MIRMVSKRASALAYTASVLVFAGLMTIVALGGSAFTSKRAAIEYTTASVAGR